MANREFLDKEIEDVLYKITRDEVRKRLIAAKIAFGAVNTIEDVSDHPALKTVKVNTPKELKSLRSDILIRLFTTGCPVTGSLVSKY